MNKCNTLIIMLICCIVATIQDVSAKRNELDSILGVLDITIGDKDVYVEQKEQRILHLKQLLKIFNITTEQSYELNNELYNEYKSFKSDSAIVYLLKNIEIAKSANKGEWVDDCKLNLSILYSVGGRYIEAEKLLESIQTNQLQNWLLIKYYESYKQLLYYYPKSEYSTQYYIYRDSLLTLLDPVSDYYKIVFSEKLIDVGRIGESRNILSAMFENAVEETHWRAVLAFSLGETYRMENDYENAKKYYAISAVSDIKNAIKENASLRALATIFHETNDVERAYKYIQQSMEDAIFSNARLRTMEVSQVFPIIEKSYQHKLEAQKNRLFYMVVCIGILSVFLIMAVVYVYVQLRRLAKARKSLSEANKQLHKLNKDLQDTNKQLSEANLLKETYISQFLDMCSMYINKLEKYRNTLNKKAMERKLDELYQILKSRDMIENELKELYEIFDNIFLHLYPNFVEEFNSLLVPEERFELKSNELLNTELRIFALIRLGITDSSKIAGFLHYSATTIYNYRTRVRNKSAVPREEFESRVMKIGLISK